MEARRAVLRAEDRLRSAFDTIFAVVSTLLTVLTVREKALTHHFKTEEHLQEVAH